MRRAALLLLAAAALALSAGCGGGASSTAGGDTRASTLADPGGSGRLSGQPGESLVDRGGRARPIATLATWAQITDVHVRDEESPLRVPFLDRLGPPFQSTFRPQEALTTQVLEASVATLDAARPQAVVVTGDIADNAQRDEERWAMTALRGGVVRPDSGAPGPSGPQVASDPDPFFYRPDVDAPRHPGLLAAAQRAFRSPGLRMPWYALPGNHDLLVQGEIAPSPTLERVATGDRRLVSLDLARLRDLPHTEAALAAPLVGRLEAAGTTVPTAPDPARRLMSSAEVLGLLRAASGHGATVAGRFDYAFDIGGGAVRAIALDLVRRDRGAAGLVDATTLAFLRRELRAAGTRPVVVLSHQPLDRAQGGDAALALLARDRQVVAAIAGDTHRNEIRRNAGVWIVTTSSLIDFPQQARMFRLVRTAGGGLALETWMLDHGPGPGGLAAISRQLAYLDAQGGRPAGFAGTREDRNARLYVR